MSKNEKIETVVLNNFLSEWPDDWNYDKVIEQMSFYNYLHAEGFAVWEPYEDWNTRDLAEHISQLVKGLKEVI